jgi:adenylosuccinate lyase
MRTSRSVLRDRIKTGAVYPENLAKNLAQTGGLWASEGILLSLVGKGLARQGAYVLVQRNAMRAFADEGQFHDFLAPRGRASRSHRRARGHA